MESDLKKWYRDDSNNYMENMHSNLDFVHDKLSENDKCVVMLDYALGWHSKLADFPLSTILGKIGTELKDLKNRGYPVDVAQCHLGYLQELLTGASSQTE